MSNCQGLGRKNKHEILKTYRIMAPRPVPSIDSNPTLEKVVFIAGGWIQKVRSNSHGMVIVIALILAISLGVVFNWGGYRGEIRIKSELMDGSSHLFPTSFCINMCMKSVCLICCHPSLSCWTPVASRPVPLILLPWWGLLIGEKSICLEGVC